MQYTEIKFYTEDCGYDTKVDDPSITITFAGYNNVDSLCLSEESLTKIKDTIASIDVHDAIGLERVHVSYWEDMDGYRERLIPIKGTWKGKRKA